MLYLAALLMSQRLSQSRHERRLERMQACIIGMSMDPDIKIRSRRWKRTRLYTYAKAQASPLTRSVTVP